MSTRWSTLLLLAGLFLDMREVCAARSAFRLSRGSDSFFVEDDRVYARALWFRPDGTYRQINRDRKNSEEVDRGTWEQSASGEIALHPTNGMLLHRALSAGPLLLLLTAQAPIDSLPALRGKIASFLQTYEDQIFAASAVADLATTEKEGEKPDEKGAAVLLPDQVESFNRSDLEDLLRAIDIWLASKRSNTFIFEPVTIADGPTLLIQRGAVFSLPELPAARALVAPNKAPPFYFAQVDRRIFSQQAGKWKPFENLGGLHVPTASSKLTP